VDERGAAARDGRRERHGGRVSYAVVTPARNEVENLTRLAAALAAQTLTPDAWIVVEDGSTDDTPGLLARLAAEHPWIRPVKRSAIGGEQLAAGRREGRALDGFRAGVRALEGEYDVVVKVDADVDFDPDYFETLIGRMAADPRLGIASGTCY